MNKTKIEWADYTWNPIKGLCPEGCWYCYARAIYKRFKLDPEPWLVIAELNMALHTERTGKRVFVCSTFEIFSPVADTIYDDGHGFSWRALIFDVIRRRPDLTFIILTKRPERIDRPMPANVWLGVSLTGEDFWKDYGRISDLCNATASVKFVSAEPLLGALNLPGLIEDFVPDWFIVGRLTGHGHFRDPNKEWLREISEYTKQLRVPLFAKNNLKGIWPGPLIQEYPPIEGLHRQSVAKAKGEKAAQITTERR